MPQAEMLLEIQDLSKQFITEKSFSRKPLKCVRAVDGVSLSIRRGETIGIVGESGCGKSTLGRSILRLIEPSSGKVFFEGEDITVYKKEKMREMRRRMQLIFQDPYASLNPRMTVLELIKAPLDAFRIGTNAQRVERVRQMMEQVGMQAQQMNRYPHEFSGGQRQRIVIARALVLGPAFVVCDEPVSALDVSVRSQVLNLIKDLQAKNNLTYLFISHDLSVVKYISDRIAVMYLGRIVELADKNDLYNNALHPYSQALLSSIPVPDVEKRMQRIILQGDVPSPLNPPAGCHFHTRCKYAEELCRVDRPVLREYQPGHFAACHLCEKGES